MGRKPLEETETAFLSSSQLACRGDMEACACQSMLQLQDTTSKLLQSTRVRVLASHQHANQVQKISKPS